MKFFVYARKSTESEDRQVQSIDDQLQAMKEMAVRLGLQIADVLTESKSAKAPGLRPVFDDMLRRIQLGEAEGILCWSTNRLFRNSVDYGQVAWLLQQGIIRKIHTADREYLPEDNVLLMAVEAGVATQYVIDLRKAVLRGLDSKVSKGWFPGKAPLGYRNDKLSRQIEPDGARFKLMRKAWEMVLSGSYTVPEILDELQSWGFPKVTRSNLYKAFSNPFYCGCFKYRSVVYPGNHKAMVTQFEFERAQELLHKAAHIQPQKHEFPFTGLIRCGVCGCLITAERHVKTYRTTGNIREYVYYRCTGNRGCTKKGVRAEVIESQILQMLSDCRLDPEFGEFLHEFAEEIEATNPDSGVTILTERTRRLQSCKVRIDRLLELRLANEISADEYQDNRLKVRQEMSDIEMDIRKDAERQDREWQSLKNCVLFATSAFRDFCGGDVKTKRAIAVGLSGNYLLNRGKLEIQPHPLLERIRTFEPPKTTPQQIRSGVGTTKNLLRCCIVDNIRTAIAEDGLDFCYPLPPPTKDENRCSTPNARHS